MVNNKEKNFISAVIYVYNKENEIKEFLTKINETLKNNFNKYEIICVNDASKDKSVEKIKEFTNSLNDETVTIVNMSFYQGIELSMNAGVDLAIGDFVLEFDSVESDIEEKTIIDVYTKCLEGFDIVSATSKDRNNKTSTIFYKIFNKYSGVNQKIHTETFRIISRRAINRVNAMGKNVTYRKVFYANCGLKTYNLLYSTNNKTKRKFDKETQKSRRELAINSLILFTNIGYKFSITMSLIMIIATLCALIYTIVIFVIGAPVRGWTTTMLFMAFGFLGFFIIMTIVIKYLEIIVNLLFKKNKYTIESIDKLQ